MMERDAFITLSKAVEAMVADAVRVAVREELAARDAARASTDEDLPKPSHYWAERLGTTPNALAQRVRRGTLEATRVGGRLYFTKAQIEGRARR